MSAFDQTRAEARALKDTAAAWISRRDKGLSADEEAELELWLGANAQHRAAYDWLASTWRSMDRPVQRGAVDDVLEVVAGLDRRRRRRRVAIMSGAMAVVLLVAAVGRRPPSVVAQPSVAATAKVIQPGRQILPDGTEVELKDGAQISTLYTKELRRVILLQGEAHFAVWKDPARPFVVEAGGIGFRAVGTAFNVQMARGTVEMIVTEGRVAVEKSGARTVAITQADDAPTAKPLATVEAGNRVLLATSTVEAERPVVVPMQQAEMSERLGWRATRLEFTGTPLAEALVLLNRELSGRGGVRFVLAEPELGKTRISGLFRADNTDALLELLETGFGISAGPHRGNEIVLQKAR